MLRASEYLPPPNPLHGSRRVLRGCDVLFYKGGQLSDFRDADEVSIQLREAKNETRSHHATGLDICPVKALQDHTRQNPIWVSDPLAVVF